MTSLGVAIRVLTPAAAIAFIAVAPAVAQTPVVERIEPTSGPVGTQVGLVGRNLGGQLRARMGDRALRIVRQLPHRVTVEVPEGAASGRVVVENRRGGFAGPFFRIVAGRSAPVVERLDPASGPGGTQVVLHGQNFSPRLSDNRVSYGGRPVVVRSATPTTLSVVVPPNAATGTFSVQVVGAGSCSSPTFTVGFGDGVREVVPTFGAPNSEVILRGAGFSPRPRQNRVQFQGRPVRVIAASPTELRVRVPEASGVGRFTVDVRRGARSESPEFTVRLGPTITTLSQSSAAPGATITLRGQHFGRDIRRVRVTLGGRPLILRRVTDTEIDVELPSGVASGRLRIEAGGIATDGPELSIRLPLAVQSFRPTSGAAGSEVTIRGQGFSTDPAANQVTLSGATAQVLAASATELRVRIGSSRSGPFVVTVPGSGQARSGRPFIVTRPPFIASFSPARGAPGSEVIIAGNGFGNNLGIVTVRLGGRPMSLRSVSDGRIVALVPDGAPSGPITVDVRLQGTSRSAQSFEVDAPFGVTGLRPVSGFVGSTVRITGSGFEGTPTVQFTGGTTAPAAVLSSSELRVVVPTGARSGPVQVRTPSGQSMTAPHAFAVTVQPAGVGVRTVEPVCLTGGCEVVLTGHGFSARPRQNRVRLGGRPVRVISASPGELRVRIPRVQGTHRFEIDVRGTGTAESTPITVQ
ncbi:MAG: IPT/TIG domain-containing protein [Myxococcota bacterium]